MMKSFVKAFEVDSPYHFKADEVEVANGRVKKKN